MNRSIDFVVEEAPTEEHINEADEYVFSIYTSSYCDGELESTLDTMAKLWSVENLNREVTLHINVRLRSVYDSLYASRVSDGAIDEGSEHMFDALKKECQWIIDGINTLKG
tara:strand:- start:16703 stop:17035 length:333 start_codon:yes stop_codon:yes gene_type:complete